MLLKNYEESARDVEDAFNLAEEFWNQREDATPNEIYSAQLFAGNRATLAMYGHDDEALSAWFGKGTGLFEKHWEVGKRYVRYLRIILSKRHFDLTAAAEAGCEGLADAIQEKSADYQDLYHMNLADLFYRMGDTDRAAFHLIQVITMYDKLGEVRRKLVALPFLASIEARRGNLLNADQLYQEASELVSRPSHIVSADILSARSIIAACLGRFQAAESLMDEAIDLAVESGERDILLLVARRAGDVFRTVNDKAQARDAYTRALEIGDTIPIEGAKKAPTNEMARIWLGLCEIDRDRENLKRLLSVAENALHDDADFWWELPRILQLLQVEDRLAFPIKDVNTVLRAASQRSDCYELLSYFKAA
jgi:predicted negative regulator of RcsB-dependent stress response